MELTIFRDFPFGKVSIEQLNRFAPLRFSLSFQLRATNTRPLQLISVCICFPSFQLPVFIAKLNMDIISCRPLWRNSKTVGSSSSEYIISETGRALPVTPTKRPTKAWFPDSLISNQEG